MITIKHESARRVLRSISPHDFLGFGLNQIAYIRPVEDGLGTSYALHAADGSPLSMIESFDAAVVEARQHDLFPVTLH